MTSVSFLALAPRHGTRPILAGYSDIGFSGMSGGAFSWGSIWSGLKSFGSSVKNLGSKAWNSTTGQMLRDKLKDTNAQQKIVDGLAAGIHGAIDLANQAVAKKIEQHLERPVDPGAPPPGAAVEETLLDEVDKLPPPPPPPPLPPPPSYEEAIAAPNPPRKRPLDEEDVLVVDGPPAYDDIFANKSPPPIPAGKLTKPMPPPPGFVDRPTTLELRPGRPVATVVAPTRQARNWQSTLNSIVGLGVRSCKRRRCY